DFCTFLQFGIGIEEKQLSGAFYRTIGVNNVTPSLQGIVSKTSSATDIVPELETFVIPDFFGKVNFPEELNGLQPFGNLDYIAFFEEKIVFGTRRFDDFIQIDANQL